MDEYGKPPFDEIKKIMEIIGYEVISIGAVYKGFPGAIDLQIAPSLSVEDTSFMDFKQIPPELIRNLRECTTLPPRQGA